MEQRRAKKSYQREHIGQYIEENKSDFSCGGVEIFDSDFALSTLDEPEDYVFLQKIAQCLNSHCFSIWDVLELHRKNPHLSKINSKLLETEGYSSRRRLTMLTGKEIYSRAKSLIPGGTQLLSKRPNYFLLTGQIYKSAKGVKITDLMIQYTLICRSWVGRARLRR